MKIERSICGLDCKEDLGGVGLDSSVEVRVAFEVLLAGKVPLRAERKSRAAQRKDYFVRPCFAAAHADRPRKRLKHNVLVLAMECHRK